MFRKIFNVISGFVLGIAIVAGIFIALCVRIIKSLMQLWQSLHGATQLLIIIIFIIATLAVVLFRMSF